MTGTFNLTTSAQPNPELERIIREHASPIAIPAKKVFLTDEREDTGVYYIVSGRTRHYLLGADGFEKVFFVLESGWFFEEDSCLLSAPPRFHVIAEEKTDLLYISKEVFHVLLRQSNRFNEAVMRSLACKLRILNREIESQVFLSGRDRFLELLYHLTDTPLTGNGIH